MTLPRTIRAVGCIVLVISACALIPDGALAGTLDQQQTSSLGAGLDVISGQSVAQTFTAGLSGKIDQVDLDLEKTGAPTAPLNVEIRSVSGGAPDSMVLTATTVPASAVPLSSLAFVPVSFAAPAPVAAGTQYAIVAYATTALSNRYEWSQGATPDPYSAGAAFFVSSTPPVGTWTKDDPVDLAFKTYVAPVTTTSSPTGQRAAALKKCKKKRTTRARKKCRKKAKSLPI